MKILWLSHFLLFPETGYGALQRSRNLLLQLSKKNDVFLLSYYRDGDLKFSPDLDLAQKDLEKYCRRVVLVPSPLNGKNKYYKLSMILESVFSKTPYSVLLFRHKVFFEKALQMIEEFSIDLVHSDTLGLSEKFLGEKSTVKILNHHNIESHMMFRRAEKEGNILKKLFLAKEGWNLKNYENTFCRQYDLNVVVSDIDKERLNGINRNIKSAVIENGVDCDYFSHHFRDQNCKGLIFTGSLDWYPNADAMLYFCRQIWPLLRKRFNNLTLNIIGKNPPPELLFLIKGEKGIFWEGFVSDVREFIKKGRVFVCPIRDGGGTRLKILDALAQGIPVVSSTVGCEGIDVINGENILMADDVEDIVNKVSSLLMDEELCNKLSGNGRRLVEVKYSFDILGRKISDLYRGTQDRYGHG